MEAKKSPKAELEKKRLSFILIGLVVALALVYVAVEWSKKDVTTHDPSAAWSIEETEGMIPITVRHEPPPPPPETKPPLEPLVQGIETVGNEENTGENLFQSSEIKPGDVIIPKHVTASRPPDVPDVEPNIIFNPFEISKPPSFKGGEAAMQKFLKDNLKYPRISLDNGVGGRVTVGFIVDKDGKLIDIQVIKGVDKYLDAEALRVVSMMPEWDPGYQLDKPVKVKCTIPINFKF